MDITALNGSPYKAGRLVPAVGLTFAPTVDEILPVLVTLTSYASPSALVL